MRFFAALLIFLAACATAPEGPPGGQPEPVPPTAEPAPPPVSRSENVAVAGLMESARADAAAGKLSTAAASIERALRIEPRNPRLWQELGRVRLQLSEAIVADRYAYFDTFLANFYNTDVLAPDRIGDAALRASFEVAAGASPYATYACIDTWLTDFRRDLSAIDIPVLADRSRRKSVSHVTCPRSTSRSSP